MNDNNIDRLEKQTSDLLELCKRLSNENGAMRAQLKQINHERATLVEQKEVARSHVESMITRLRSMEHV